MSGHSKWSQIKHKKGISDQKKGQVFSKLAKKISLAARDGSDPAMNYKLQAVINEARAANMPKDNIDRAVHRADDKSQAELREFAVSAMGPGGVAIVVKGITDNTNRSISELRNIINKAGAKVVPDGSLNWMFDQNMQPHNPIELPDQTSADQLDKLLEELDNHDDTENIYTNLKEEKDQL